MNHLNFFFRCVQDDQCGGLVDIRGLDDPVTTNLICDDPNHTCCHESVLKAANETSNSETDYYDQEQESCSSYENEGFR